MYTGGKVVSLSLRTYDKDMISIIACCRGRKVVWSTRTRDNRLGHAVRSREAGSRVETGRRYHEDIRGCPRAVVLRNARYYVTRYRYACASVYYVFIIRMCIVVYQYRYISDLLPFISGFFLYNIILMCMSL